MIRLHLPQDLATEWAVTNPLMLPSAATLATLLATLSRTHPGLASRLMLPDGKIRPHLNLFTTKAEAPARETDNVDLGDDDEVWVIRAVSGG